MKHLYVGLAVFICLVVFCIRRNKWKRYLNDSVQACIIFYQDNKKNLKKKEFTYDEVKKKIQEIFEMDSEIVDESIIVCLGESVCFKFHNAETLRTGLFNSSVFITRLITYREFFWGSLVADELKEQLVKSINQLEKQMIFFNESTELCDPVIIK